MATPIFKTLDGNEALARIAYALNDVIAISPIPPASPMGEWADTGSAAQKPNLWGTVPSIVEIQREGGVAGAVHGALQTGALTTTCTASQGLLLMLANLYQIAGELTPGVFHIVARSMAAQALSILGDHSDVIAARSKGCAMLCSASVQEAQDIAAIATAATLTSRIPFIHFFDGFRTSHEIQKIELLDEAVLRSQISEPAIQAHRQRALSPDQPVIRGRAQNSEVFFQAREAVNPYYRDCIDAVTTNMEQFETLTGREYHPFEYQGDPQAERVIVMMGSGCETVQETVDYLNRRGEKVGLIQVRLYPPFDSRRFAAALPETVQAIAVLDQTQEPGSVGEPLYLDVVTALAEQPPARLDGSLPMIVRGRYGLSSREVTSAMVKAIFDNIDCEPGMLFSDSMADAARMHQCKPPKNHFTIGINDDVTHTSLVFESSFSIDQQTEYAQKLLQAVIQEIDTEQEYLAFLAEAIVTAKQDDAADIAEQRDRVVLLKKFLHDWLDHHENSIARRPRFIPPQLVSKVKMLCDLADYLVKKSVWIIGGDGWAHNIGHGIPVNTAMHHQQAIVEADRGLLRHDPRRMDQSKNPQGENPLQLDSRSPKPGAESSI